MSGRSFKRKDFKGAFALHEKFREAAPTRALRARIHVPKTLMSMGDVEYIGYRTTHGTASSKRKVVHYHHDFAAGSRPVLAAGPGREQLFFIGGRYHVTERGIVDLDASDQEIDDPGHGEDLT